MAPTAITGTKWKVYSMIIAMRKHQYREHVLHCAVAFRFCFYKVASCAGHRNVEFRANGKRSGGTSWQIGLRTMAEFVDDGARD